MGNFRGATFTLSLDCEFLWGNHYIGGLTRFPYLKDGIESYYRQTLEICDRHAVPATWAFVGAMSCSLSEVKQLLTKPISPEYLQRNAQILAQIESNPEHWLAPDLIRDVASSRTHHEIASHSLTHLTFNSSIMSEQVASYELEQSYQLLSRYGSDVRTFIYPENKIAHLTSFKKSSFKIYRSADPHWYDGLGSKRFFHFLDQSLPIAPSLSVQGQDWSGNAYLSGSYFLFPFDGIRSWIPSAMRVEKVKKGIDRAIANSANFHLWFHPWNLGSSIRMVEIFDEILEHVGQHARQGRLQVATMKDYV